jgi:RNA polymerase sigma-70 factor (ECF subfamily)
MTIGKGEQIAAWVQAAREGDRAAFGCLVRQFQDAVAGVVLARTGPGPDVEDITQDAFVAAWQQLDQLREPAGFGSWVCGIARNRALRWQRDRRTPVALPDNIAAPSADPPVDLADRVMAAVQALPERLREPLTLFYINGYSTEDVAGLLELPPGTVRRRLHEARHHLKEHMEGLMEDEIKKNAPPDSLVETVLDRITDIRVEPDMPQPDTYTIFIRDQADRSFPVIIGRREGEALQIALGRRPAEPQPLLYDVMLAAARHFGMNVQVVRITELKKGTFYARIELATPDGSVSLDARPSDAINLAVRAGVNMQVVRGVTDQSINSPPGPTPDELRRRIAADPDDFAVRLQMARFLTFTQIHRAITWPLPLPMSLEAAVREAAEHLVEARTLLGGVLQRSQDPEQHRQAAGSLGMVELLDGRFAEAMTAMEQRGGPWHESSWPTPLHFAVLLHRAGRDEEAFARLADTIAAIDHKHGTEPLKPARLAARNGMVQLAARLMPTLAIQPRFRAMFEPFDPPCLMEMVPSNAPTFGPAYLLEDRPLLIGSAIEADVQLPPGKAAPRHARVFRDPEGWMVEDLGSGFGTAVDGEKIDQPVLLPPGGVIHLGTLPPVRSVLFFVDIARAFPAAVPDAEPPMEVIQLLGEMPCRFRLPLVDRFREASAKEAQAARTPAQALAFPSAAQADIPPGWQLPNSPASRTARPIRQVKFAVDSEKISLLLIGDAHQEATEGPPYRHNSAAASLAGTTTVRPMTERLACAFLAACQIVCTDVVIGTADAAGQRMARMHLQHNGQGSWFDANPIDAVAAGSAMSPVPTLWICDGSTNHR